MNTSKSLTVTTALALTLSLVLAACGEDQPDVEPAASDPAASAPEETAPEEADDTSTDDTETTEEAPAQTGEDDTDQTSDAAPGADAGDLTAIALSAIETAEAETGGTAYEIDDQDEDGTWEVEVRVDDRSVEVTVSEDGTAVVSTEDDDLDEDDRAALDAATITLADAIQMGVAEVGGVLDDAELEDEDDGLPHHWEVSVDTEDGRSVEVLVSIDGEILGTDG